MIRHIFFICLGIGCLKVHAQNESDALRFSRTDILGSARYNSMGGAFTALGGDISGAYSNPAGVAVFRSSEFSLSAAYHENSTMGNYYGQQTLDGKGNFNFPSIGFVGVQNLRQAGKWRNTSFSIGMNRVYSYHEEFTLSGTGIESSILDYYTNILNEQGIHWSSFENEPNSIPSDIYLAWYNFLVDTLPGTPTQYGNASGVSPVGQSFVSQREGSRRETFLNFGGNYDDKLYLGGGLIFSNVNYSLTTIYSEYISETDTTTTLDEFSQGAYETITGRGIAVNAGVIYRPIDQLRIGLSVKSPMRQRMEIKYDADNIAVYADTTVLEAASPQEGYYRFRITSPAQATIGLAYVFRKFGLVSVDAEVVNYDGMRLFGLSDGYSFSSENDAINDYLQTTFNIRSGAEYRINSFFSLRGGFAYYGNPYKSSVDKDGSFQVYSVGFGYRDDTYFIDGAYRYRLSTDKLYLYDATLANAATVEFADHGITLTLGVRF